MNTKSPDLHRSYETQKYFKLALSILLDLVGMATFMIPGLGELGDLVWAPIAGLAGFVMYGGIVGAAGGTFTFLEELLPGTDFLPGLTLTWMVKYLVRGRKSFEQYSRRKGHEIES